jgi:hypothetical protein
MDVFFTPLEPPIYELLSWDMDAIMRCLEVIRRKLPELAGDLMPDAPEVAIFAMARGKFPGGSYPVLGVVQYTEEASAPYLAIEGRIRKWCSEVGKEGLTTRAAAVKTPTWAELKECGCYPQPQPKPV